MEGWLASIPCGRRFGRYPVLIVEVFLCVCAELNSDSVGFDDRGALSCFVVLHKAVHDSVSNHSSLLRKVSLGCWGALCALRQPLFLSHCCGSVVDCWVSVNLYAQTASTCICCWIGGLANCKISMNWNTGIWSLWARYLKVYFPG